GVESKYVPEIVSRLLPVPLPANVPEKLLNAKSTFVQPAAPSVPKSLPGPAPATSAVLVVVPLFTELLAVALGQLLVEAIAAQAASRNATPNFTNRGGPPKLLLCLLIIFFF